MGVIYPARNLRARRAKPFKGLKKLRLVAGLIVVFALINVGIAMYYNGKTYPQTTVGGVHMGNASFSSVEKKAALPDNIVLSYEDKKATVPLKDLGITVNAKRTQDSLNSSRSWLPLINIATSHQLPAPISFNDIKLQERGEQLQATFHKAPTNAALKLSDGIFNVVRAKDGSDLSISKLKAALTGGIDRGESTITAPMTFKPPVYTTAKAEADAKKFQESSSTPISFKAGTSTVKASASDIASWYQPAGDSYTLNESAIRTYILTASIKAGTRPQNLSDAVTKAKQAVESHKALTFTLVPFAVTKTYRYCVGLKGVDQSNAALFTDRAKATYADQRGWGLESQVIFTQVESECDFTLWLTSADLMPTFGEICDSMWSCRVGPNVVINFTRWQETSPSWKQYGGSLEDYRHMVINHETGHWFGFDHSSCSGTGQLAPVMMQQSIDLAGCAFNPWPTANELRVYRNAIGL